MEGLGGHTILSILGIFKRFLRRIMSTPDPDTFEKYRDTPRISIAIFFSKLCPSSWLTVGKAPPIGVTMLLPFVSPYFCRSVRVSQVGP